MIINFLSFCLLHALGRVWVFKAPGKHVLWIYWKHLRLQFLYDYLGSFEGNGTKMKVVRNYAEKHQIEIEDVQE